MRASALRMSEGKRWPDGNIVDTLGFASFEGARLRRYLTTPCAVLLAAAFATAAIGAATGDETAARRANAEEPVGYGSSTRGGDPEDRVVVTSNAATGPGTLHALATDPANSGKTIAFSTGHVITLTRHIEPRELAHVTIDGLSSPDSTPVIRGPGIVKNPLFEIKGSRGCHDWVIRGLRFKDGGDDGFIRFEEGFRNGLVTRCSFHGSADEQLSVAADPTACDSITVQACLLRQRHGSGGMLFWGGGHVTVAGCLFDTNERYPRVRQRSVAQVVNNVFFNWRAHGSRVSAEGSGDWIANVWLPTARSDIGDAVVIDDDAGPVYLARNLELGRSRADRATTRKPVTALDGLPVRDAHEALHHVLDHAGAPLLTEDPASRDADDRRVLDAARARARALGS